MSNTDKQLTQEQLSEILDLHWKWVRGEPGGVQANLRYANLAGANMWYAILTGANLRDANLEGANLEYAILEGAKLPPPSLDLSGCTVGYKKVWNKDRSKQVVIELWFPEGTKLVSTVIGRKCRASEAMVVRCVSTGHQGETEFWSSYSERFIYRVGETVRPVEPFDDSITVECTSGIHFFTTQEEAEAYSY